MYLYTNLLNRFNRSLYIIRVLYYSLWYNSSQCNRYRSTYRTVARVSRYASYHNVYCIVRALIKRMRRPSLILNTLDEQLNRVCGHCVCVDVSFTPVCGRIA